MNNDTTDEQARISQLYADNKAAFHAAQESANKGDWQAFEKTPVTNDTPADAITVIQADIDAVKRFHAESARWMLHAIKNGDPIGEERDLNHPIYQAFARHRTTSLAAQDGLVEALELLLGYVRKSRQGYVLVPLADRIAEVTAEHALAVAKGQDSYAPFIAEQLKALHEESRKQIEQSSAALSAIRENKS